MEPYIQNILSGNVEAGSCHGCICTNLEELKEAGQQSLAWREVQYVIQNVLPGIIYPIAFLHSVEMSPDFQRRGLGTRAVKEFEAFARSRLATVILLKAAYEPDAGWEEEAEWKQLFYRRLGFTGFEMEHAAFPVMYKVLGNNDAYKT